MQMMIYYFTYFIIIIKIEYVLLFSHRWALMLNIVIIHPGNTAHRIGMEKIANCETNIFGDNDIFREAQPVPVNDFFPEQLGPYRTADFPAEIIQGYKPESVLRGIQFV